MLQRFLKNPRFPLLARSFAVSKQDLAASETFYYKDLQVSKTSSPGKKPALDLSLKFGTVNTDHLLTVEWDSNKKWGKPKISPYGPLSISPMASSLHYAVQCFEGLKAFRDKDNKIRLFRPDLNMKRMKESCNRIALPDFDGNEWLKCITELIKVDQEWVPDKEGFSLYIRPTGIATNEELGVRAPGKALLFTVLTPVGPYYPTGFQPTKLYCDTQHIRAFPGGVGCNKLGSNYGPTIKVSKGIENKGYQQVLWLVNGNVGEVGTSNIFFFWKNDKGEEELVTPDLDGTILPGVTRDSILALARKWNRFKVSERTIPIKELIEKIKKGQLIEAFGAGTAAVVSPIELIHYDGVDYKVPLVKDLNAGKLTAELNKTMNDIYYGRTQNEWSVPIN